MKNIAFFSIFTAILLAGCSSSGSSSPVVYSIGDIGPSGIGRVFYTTDDGHHGLEVAPMTWYGTAEDPAGAWSNITDALVSPTKLPTALGTGYANTVAIIAQSGHTASAAQHCRNYSGGGKLDWFLPSQDELTTLAANKPAGWEYLTTSAYWSSSEYAANRPYCVTMPNGDVTDTTGKISTNKLTRPIRAF